MKWQLIEIAPKDGTKVLIVNENGDMAVAGYIAQWIEVNKWIRTARDGDVYRTEREDTGYWDTEMVYCPTHWMPLPEAP